MRGFVLSLLCTILAAQPPLPGAPQEPSLRPAPAALAAKAPGHPAYGLEVAIPEGMFLLTHLRYDPISPGGRLEAYRMNGPATWGPYDLGMNIGVFVAGAVGTSEGIYTWGYSRFEVLKVDPDGPARRAGLDETWWILQVDGQDFQWQATSLLRYATHRPTIDVLAQKRSGWGKGKEKHFQIQLRRREKPADPCGAEVWDSTSVEQVLLKLRPQLTQPATWRTLAQLRASTPRFTPISVDLSGHTWWVVRGGVVPPQDHALGLDAEHQLRWIIRHKEPQLPGVTETQDRVFLEFWQENPAGDAPADAPDFLCAEPSDHVLKGRLLRLQDRWVRVTDAALDPADGRLAKLAVQPWTPDIHALLGGATPTQDLGPGSRPADWVAVEQSANDALVEWKTRKLPAILANETAAAAEDLVVRLEKGVLALDLKVRNFRASLDAAALAEADRKAQAELAARQGGPVPAIPAPSTAEVQQASDLFDQRKAILMAVLGSAKQALASLRR